MIKIKCILFCALLSVLFFTSGYAKQAVTKGDLFPEMYSEQPRSILVLPPLNRSAKPEVSEYYMATIEMPLSLAGYYVFPVELVSNFMKQEGIYDTNLLYTMPLTQFAEHFGSDAVLYSRINKWSVAQTGHISRLIVSIEAEIISTKTAKQLWKDSRTVMVNLSGENTTVKHYVRLLMTSISKDADAAVVSSVSYAHKANSRLLQTLPFGPYHENYLQDQQVELSGRTPKK